MLLSGLSPDGRLVEIVELRDHPWFVASQFHPEFKSRPERPHPLFHGFVTTALALRDGVEPVLDGGRDATRTASSPERRRRARSSPTGPGTSRASPRPHPDPALCAARRSDRRRPRSTSRS